MKRLLSFRYAMNGISAFFRQGPNAKIQLLAGITAIIAGLILNISPMEWIAVIFCCALVLSLEMINTAIEKTCDLISTEYHPLIKTIKDVAAGAVLLSAVASLIIGVIIFLPKILSHF